MKFIMALFLIWAAILFGAPTSIRELKLTSDADANGHSISNLHSDFLISIGGASTQQLAEAVAPLAGTQSVAEVAGALDIHTNDTANPHGVTAAQIGALTNETDAAALAALASFAGTNRVTRLWGADVADEWMTITNGVAAVWRVNTVTNTFTDWSVIIEAPISICGEIIQPSTNQWPGIPYPLWTDSALSYTQFITNYPAGSTQPMVVWYYYRTGSASPHEVHFSSPAAESSANWYSSYDNSGAGASPRFLLGQDDISPILSSDIIMVSETKISVSVVTSLVSTVAWQSDLAVFATTQHVAEAIAAIPEPDMAGKVDVAGGTATNLSTHGWLALPQTQATNLVVRLVTSNDVILAIGVWE